MSRILLVTGANSSLGNSLIDDMGNDFDVILAHYGHNHNNIDDLIAKYGNKVVPIQADLSDEDAIADMLAYIKNNDLLPDCFVHFPAPQFEYTKFSKADLQTYKYEMQVVYFSFVQICRYILPYMTKCQHGKVVALLTAYTESYQPSFMSDYISAKFALLGMVKALASEFAAYNVQINGVSPDMVDTKFISGLPNYIKENVAKNRKTGKILTVGDVIPVIKYLLTDDSSSIYGQNILIP